MSFTVSDVKGAITPLVTPFHDDGSLDLDSIGRLIDWQLERGTHGISVGGSTGEPTSQTVAERIEVMRTAVAAIDGRVPFLPGTGTARLDETFELTAEAQSLGAPAALVVTPYYARPTQQGLFDWYSADRERVPGPADPRLQRADPLGGRHHAGDGRPAAPRARQHRRDQGDDARLRARLLRARHLRHRLHRALGDRAALLPDARARRRRPPVVRGELRARSRPRELYDAFVAGDQDARAASCTTSCTRSSTRRSPRRTRCRRSGSCTAWGSCRRRSRGSLWRG